MAKTSFMPPSRRLGTLSQITIRLRWQLAFAETGAGISTKSVFCTGVPDPAHSQFWSDFWKAKLGTMGHRGVVVFSRRLRYRNRTVKLPDGTIHTYLVGQEKGIDVRMALDIVRLARRDAFDVALVFSQDQDLSEVAEEIRIIAQERTRWIKIASAFPTSPVVRNQRGITQTDWIQIDRATYDACLDRKDYRGAATGDKPSGAS